METINLITVLAALDKYNSSAYIGDRAKWHKDLIEMSRRDISEIMGYCEEYEMKFSDKVLLTAFGKVVKASKVNRTNWAESITNGFWNINKEEFYQKMNKEVGEEIPLAYFNRFCDRTLYNNMVRFLVSKKKKDEYKKQLASAKQNIAWAEETEAELFGED